MGTYVSRRGARVLGGLRIGDWSAAAEKVINKAKKIAAPPDGSL